MSVSVCVRVRVRVRVRERVRVRVHVCVCVCVIYYPSDKLQALFYVQRSQLAGRAWGRCSSINP